MEYIVIGILSASAIYVEWLILKILILLVKDFIRYKKTGILPPSYCNAIYKQMSENNQ